MTSFMSVSHPDSCFFEDAAYPYDVYLPECLVPGSEPLDWWTGHPDITAGCEVFLYVTAPFSAIHFLLAAVDDPHKITAAESTRWEGKWGFPFETLFYYPDGLTIAEMRAIPELAGWSALRGNFQGTGFPLPSAVADAIRRALAAKNPLYARLGAIPPAPVCARCGTAGGPLTPAGQICDTCTEHIKSVLARRRRLRTG